MSKKVFVGDLLLKAGLIDEAQLQDALRVQETTGQRLGDIFVEKGILTSSDLIRILENQMNVAYVDLEKIALNHDLVKYVPLTLARRNNLVPVKLEGGVLYVAIEDPKNFPALDDVRITSRMEVQPLLAKEQSIRETIEKLYGSQYAERALEDVRKEINIGDMITEMDSSVIDAEVDNAPIVRLVSAMMEQAISMGASDIHIEPMPTELRVRMRVDGVLSTQISAPAKSVGPAVMTRLKILSNLNIAERRLPQDGRFEYRVPGHKVDVRLSILPTVFGEKAVMRLLDQSTFLKPKAALGFTEENLEKFDNLLQTPHGIILMSGPTGSGKSTTLYTMLAELNTVTDNIVTVEDPVEYLIPGLNQVNVNAKAGLDFASGLRSILRQDPDIIMIGEIRDSETVEIAIRAAITGHLVLSTIHTNDSISTIFRLADMGVPYFLVAASLVGVISQRLVRTICPACKQEYQPTQNELALAGVSSGVFYKGAGCSNCSGTGYRGRMAVHEILTIDNTLRDMIHNEESAGKMRDYATQHGLVLIKHSATDLLLSGKTTLEQVIEISHGS